MYFLKRKSDAAVALQQAVKYFASKNIAMGTLFTDVGGEFAKGLLTRLAGKQPVNGGQGQPSKVASVGQKKALLKIRGSPERRRHQTRQRTVTWRSPTS